MRSRCTSIRIVGDTGRCDVIDHVVDVDYFRSVSVEVNSRGRDDVIVADSADSSTSWSSTHDVSESVTSSPTNDVIESMTSLSRRTESGSVCRVEIVLQYGVGRLGVAVGGASPVKVKVVRRGGEGHRAGLAVGDEIVDVEGRDVSRDKPEAVAGLLRSWPGDTLRLTVARSERDDSGHASSSSDDVIDNTSGYSCLPTRRDSDQFTSGKQYHVRSLNVCILHIMCIAVNEYVCILIVCYVENLPMVFCSKDGSIYRNYRDLSAIPILSTSDRYRFNVDFLIYLIVSVTDEILLFFR